MQDQNGTLVFGATGSEAAASSSSSSNVRYIAEKRELPTLAQILRADQDVRDFYNLIHDYDLRSKALELLEKRLQN